MTDSIVSMVTEAFELQDWIRGTSTGGIEPVRNVLKVDVENKGEETRVTVSWDYPETCGLSDCVYHVVDPHAVRKSVFVYKQNSLALEGGQLFDEQDLFFRESRDKVDQFYKKHRLTR